MKKYFSKIFYIVLFSPLLFQQCSKRNLPIEIRSYSPSKENNILLIDTKRDLLYGSIETAEIKLLELVRQDSLYSPAFYELGRLYFNKEDYSKAEIYSNVAFNLSPSNYWYQLLFLNALLKNGKKSIAIPIVFHILETNSKRPEIFFEMLDLLEHNRMYDEMERVITLYEKNFGYQDEIVFAKYQILLQKGKIKDVYKYLFQIIKRDPYNVAAHLFLGNLYHNDGNPNNAIKHYNTALTIDPTNIHANKEVIKIFLKKGEYDKAIEKIETKIIYSTIDVSEKIQILLEVLAYSDKFSRLQISKIEDFIVLLKSLYPYNPGINYFHGELMYRRNNLESAINSFEISLSQKPDNLELWNFTIFICYPTKNYQKLIELANKAIKYYPNIRDFYMLRGYAFMNVDSLELSYKDFDHALKLTGALDKSKIDILHALAEVSHRLGNTNETFQYYKTLLSYSPNDIVALNNYAYFLALEKKELDSALQMSLKTIKAEPKNYTYLDTYAYILFVMKRYQEALKYIELAILYGGGTNATILEHYGDILYFNNKTEDAITSWKEAAERGGGSKHLQVKIEMKMYVED